MSDHTTSRFPMPPREEWMCQYTGKLCYNPRAVSARRHNPGLLRLCTFHRALANRNQFRYQQRQRLLRQLAETNALPAPAMATCSTSPRTPGFASESCGVPAPTGLEPSSLPPFPSDEVSRIIEEVDAMICSWGNDDEIQSDDTRGDELPVAMVTI